MLPLLSVHLSRIAPEAVPRGTLSKITQFFELNLRRNLLLAGELCRILGLFHDHGIEVIPYKGPVLAEWVYGSLALRQFADLDILVHGHEVLRAKALLLSEGYRQPFQLTPAQEKHFLASDCQMSFYRADIGACVEVHWRIDSKYLARHVDTDRLWRRKGQVPFAGQMVPSFSPEDLLLILCVHGAKHCWQRLEWIVGVAELVRVHVDLDWGYLLEQARRQGSRRMLFLGLCLARELLGAALPERAMLALEGDSALRSLAMKVRTRLFCDEASAEDWALYLFSLEVRQNQRDRARYCLRQALIPTKGDWDFLSLPESLFWLYYPLRPLRLLGKQGLKGMRYVLRAYRNP